MGGHPGEGHVGDLTGKHVEARRVTADQAQLLRADPQPHPVGALGHLRAGQPQGYAVHVHLRVVAPQPGHGGAQEVRLAEEVGDEGRAGSFVERCRVAHLLEATAVHHRDGVGHGHRLLLVVGDVDEGQADLLLDPFQLDLHLPAQLEVERPEGLVEQEDIGPVDDGPGQGDALLHPAGELAGLLAGRVSELDEVERSDRLGLPVPVPAPTQAERDVVEDVEVREERVVLEDGVDVALVGLRVRDVPVADRDRALARLLEPGHHPQRRRLAAARRPEQREERAPGDGQVEVVHCRERLIRPRDALQPQVTGRLRVHHPVTRAWNLRL